MLYACDMFLLFVLILLGVAGGFYPNPQLFIRLDVLYVNFISA